MNQRVFFAKGVFVSSIAAGPIFIAVLGLATVYATLPKALSVEAIDSGLGAIGAVLFGSIAALLFGFVVSVLPNALGGALLGHLGLHSETARLPLVWALSGSVFMAIPIALAGGLRADSAMPAAVLIITSGICALIVRRYTRWVEVETEDAPTPAPAFVSPPEQSALGHRNTGSRLLD
jgi:hypothetical protein